MVAVLILIVLFAVLGAAAAAAWGLLGKSFLVVGAVVVVLTGLSLSG